jgi:hypothetical protein
MFDDIRVSDSLRDIFPFLAGLPEEMYEAQFPGPNGLSSRLKHQVLKTKCQVLRSQQKIGRNTLRGKL